MGPDTEQLQRTLEGVLDHPNVSAALILGLGCEVNQIDHYLGRNGAGETSAALHGLTLQDSGGTRGTVEAARKQIREFIERAASEKRSEVPASKLALGLNCGGSDSFSGITANPALGLLLRSACGARRRRRSSRDDRNFRSGAPADAPCQKRSSGAQALRMRREI